MNPSPSSRSSAPAFERAAFLAAALLGALIALLPFGRSAEVAVLGLVGLALWAGWRSAAERAALGLALSLWACYTLPAALSALDSYDQSRSWASVAASLRYLGLLLAALWLLGTSAWTSVARATSWIVLFWTADAWIQAATGFSLGGGSAIDRLTGIFGADDPKLGQVLAVLSPFLLVAVEQKHPLLRVLLYLAVLGVVLMSGSRAAWIMYACVSLAWAWRLAGGTPRRFLAALSGLMLLGGGVLALLYLGSERFAARLERSTEIFDRATLDYALAGRLPIWQTAWSMSLAHPVNGVGVRAFRYAYPDYAAPNDPWVSPDGRTGAAHPHYLPFELSAELGVIGLIGWVLGGLLLGRLWLRAPIDARRRAWPAAVGLLAMVFPLNTHLAFYASFWGLLFWWLVAMLLAALAASR